MEHILSLLVFFPAMAGLLGFLVAKESIRAYGISVSVIEFCLSLILWIGFDSTNAGYQFVEYYAFIPSYGMSYYLGVDGISLFLVVLSTFITMIALIGLSIEKDIKNLIISVLFFRNDDGRCFPYFRCDLVLCLLGTLFGTDALYYWCMGRREAYVCCGEVFSLYVCGFSIDVSGYFVYGLFVL